MSQGSHPAIPDDAAVVENSLELDGSSPLHLLRRHEKTSTIDLAKKRPAAGL